MANEVAILFSAGKLRMVVGENRPSEIPRHPLNWPGCPLTAVGSKTIIITWTCCQIIQQIAKQLISGIAICNQFLELRLRLMKAGSISKEFKT